MKTDIRDVKADKNGFLREGFNQKKALAGLKTVRDNAFGFLRNLAKNQCRGKNPWPQIEKINAWMLSAETATFMKWGGLGMVASELPEVFNQTFAKNQDTISIITPMYVGDTGKKHAHLDGEVYTGSENNAVDVKKIATIIVPFAGKRRTLIHHKADVYVGHLHNVDYIFLKNDRFFSINPHTENPSTQDGCYVYNENGVNEVERFAFFSKAVCVLLGEVLENKIAQILSPNLLIANDWHSGAVAGLCKYKPLLDCEMSPQAKKKMQEIPIIHIAHHMGYQGWDYANTAKILNSLYETHAAKIFRNAQAIKHANPRTVNTLIVYDCYNQASANLHLADRVVTVSKNYAEEVSKELGFGHDFRDILKIRKNHRTFFGIVNGYDKNQISPNNKKINQINTYFKDFKFCVYDQNSPENKLINKQECIRLLSALALSPEYKNQVIPLIETYKFKDISKLADIADKIPFVCATSRLVEQKGYDIAAKAILKLIAENSHKGVESPIFVLGGAGDLEQYRILQNLKDEVEKNNPEAAKRIFVFRGYRDEFAYALQLAADFYLMPSRFEPCGLTQMEAMAKGCLPIAMSTGGLVDTINDHVDGFRTEVFFAGGVRVYGSNLKAQKFKNNINAYADAMYQALSCFYTTPDILHNMTRQAMEKDFSWSVPNGSVYKYYNLFKTGSL